MHVSDQNQRRQYKKHIKNIKYAQQTLFTDSVWYRLAERGICLSAIVGEISSPFSENSFARSRAASVCRRAALARGTPFFFAKHKSRNIEKDNLYRVVLCLAEKEGFAFQRSLARKAAFSENLFARSRAASVCRRAALARVLSSFPANKIGQLSLSYDVAEKEGVEPSLRFPVLLP